MRSDWYALAVQPRKELFVEQQLKAKGTKALCPRFSKIVRHARQTKTVLAPLFPGYIFVNLNPETDSWRSVNWVPGSIGLVRFDREPARLPVEFAASFLSGVDDTGRIELENNFSVGDRVQTIGGPFDNMVGEIVCMSDNERIKILTEALNRKVEMTVPRSSMLVAV